MPLELTTRFTAISTSPKARGGMSASDAAGKAAAHLRYIARPAAVAETAVSGLPAASLDDTRAALRERIRVAASRGGKSGARVLERGIVSLPNSWTAEARQDACARIAAHLAPADSDAACMIVVHRDKSRNSHLHFAAVDGMESREAALARRPDAKRVRRRNVLRLGDLGRPKELRAEIAGILNGIAAERGLDGVEWRSFEDRGLAQRPKRHEGPTRRAIAEKARARAATERFLDGWGADPIDELFDAPEPPQAPQRAAAKGSAAPEAPPASQQPPTAPPGPGPDKHAERLARVRAAARKRAEDDQKRRSRRIRPGPSLDD